MTCTSCGDKPKNSSKGFPRAVVEINNPESLVLLRKVVIPVSMGTEEDVPPAIGKYFNVLLQYEANGHIYLYSSDGIPTAIEANIPQEVLDRIEDLEIDVDLLETGLANETTAREAADSALSSSINSLSSSLSAETAAREQADAALEGDINNLTADLEEETTARETADTALGGRIDTVADNLATETANRISADEDLQADITAEATARQNADTTLQNNITAEATARQNADTTLQNNITAEATARENGDAALNTAITSETTARQEADTNLQNQITQEAQARAAADTAINGAITSEATARQTADAGLQSQIDAITAGSDVKDIVGTKAELNNYDTSTLGNNDIIKVLQDESENNATTYYRWNATTQQFTLIGEEGPYYTKSQADTLLNAKQNTLTAGPNVQIVNDAISATDTTYTAGTGLALNGTQFSVDTTTIATQSDLTAGLANKQDTLTAGTNIQINNNTISATDTTYTDFTGTDGTTAGTSGLVPAPATTDAGKVLGADGSWVTGGPTVVQTTGTSTADVMSQDAVTNLIFTDDTYYQQIAIGYGAKTGGPSDGNAYSTAVGFGAFAGGVGTTLDSSAEATAIGAGSYARGKYGTAIGRGARVNRDGLAKADGGVSIGSFATAYGTGIAIGGGPVMSSGVVAPASANGDGTIAIGIGAKVNNLSGTKGAIALGAGAATGTTGVMSINTSNTSYGYNNSNYRLLTGLYDPQSAHDAATKGYVDNLTITYAALNGASAPTTATAGTYVGQLYLDTTNDKMYYLSAIDTVTPEYTWEEIGGGSGETTLYSKTAANAHTAISSLDIAGNGTQATPYAPCHFEDNNGEDHWFYVRTNSLLSSGVLEAYVGGYSYDAAESYWGGKKEARLALYSDVHDATLTIQQNGATVDTFSANASTNKTVNIETPATFTTNEWNALWA